MKTDTVLAVDIGGSKIMAALLDINGNILEKLHQPLPPAMDREWLTETVAHSAIALMGHYPGTVAAGVAIPGLADRLSGVWKYACFSGIGDFPIASVLSGRLGLPVFIGNDVNVCAYGEKRYGCCRDTDDFLWVTVSNGIGGGVVLRGEVYEGAHGYSGEIGHMVVEEQHGRQCPCGHFGCLEAQASGRAISAHYEGLSGNKAVSAKDIALLARQGDGHAVEAYGMAGRYLGKAVAAAANLFNPEKVVFGGGVSMDLDLLLPGINAAMESRIFTAANGNLVLEKTALGYDAALIGAAATAWKEMGL